MSDGGCTNPGDIAKAFQAGADFVMIGGLFAGHDQSGGDLDGKHRKGVQALLRNVIRHCHKEASRIRRRVPSIRGQDHHHLVPRRHQQHRSQHSPFIRVTQQIYDMYVPFEVPTLPK